MKKLKVFVCLFFILIPSFVLSQSGEVIKVKDGDTVDILSNGSKVLLFINNREWFRIETLVLEDFGAQFASSCYKHLVRSRQRAIIHIEVLAFNKFCL